MRAVLKVLAAGALAAPLLAGCVVYSNEAGETVRVNMGDVKFTAAEAIRGARFEDGALVVRVDSNGCTQASDFELSVADGSPADITLTRTREDMCKALVADGVELRWTYADLGLEPGTPTRILNPLK
ncbi:hypothetical protein CCR92_21380 [Rhodospirillum rubrum]|uniref:hypothetical protein n=1 Tax=Brevundimonas sp. UBA7534 TaxID=1946138 RepID=UPI001915BDF6|nr:hypothetical protein [Brevundimonas sp. UBA7534]MBK5956521.1 hypothetical protein [Rhodospirillum rubrum]